VVHSFSGVRVGGLIVGKNIRNCSEKSLLFLYPKITLQYTFYITVILCLKPRKALPKHISIDSVSDLGAIGNCMSQAKNNCMFENSLILYDNIIEIRILPLAIFFSTVVTEMLLGTFGLTTKFFGTEILVLLL
jgi:hypothetical protein